MKRSETDTTCVVEKTGHLCKCVPVCVHIEQWKGRGGASGVFLGSLLTFEK